LEHDFSDTENKLWLVQGSAKTHMVILGKITRHLKILRPSINIALRISLTHFHKCIKSKERTPTVLGI